MKYIENFDYCITEEEYILENRIMSEIKDLIIEAELTDVEYEIYLASKTEKYKYVAQRFGVSISRVKGVHFRINKKIERLTRKIEMAQKRRECQKEG